MFFNVFYKKYYRGLHPFFTSVHHRSVTLTAASDGLVTSFGKRDRWVSDTRDKHRSIIFSSA